MKAREGLRRFSDSKNNPAPGGNMAKINSAPSSNMPKINLAPTEIWQKIIWRPKGILKKMYLEKVGHSYGGQLLQLGHFMAKYQNL